MLVPLSARQTTDLAAAALASGRGAGLPELLELIQTLTGQIDRVSLAELSELIEQDPVVAARLINLANLIALNPGMTSLSSVTHAIHQIGFQRVRSLAISLMLLKSGGARQHADAQRQAAARALCAGLLAQACARQVTAVDPELVFACATLRQLGRILLPVVSVDHYQAALAEAGAEPEDAAFARHFGLTPLDLSRAVLRAYKLPRDVQDALGDYPPRADDTPAHSARLLALAEFGGRLTRVVLDVSLDEAAYAAATQRLATEFAGPLPAVADLLPATLDGAGERLQQFAQMPGATTYPEMMLRRIRSRLPKPAETAEGTAPVAAAVPPPDVAPEPLPSAAPFPSAPASPSRPPAAPPVPDPVAAAAIDLPDAITLVPETVRPASPAEPWREVLWPVQDGFAAADCAVFLRSAPRGPFVLADGLGPFAAHHRDLASVHPDEQNVFTIAFRRRETVVIHDARTPSLQAYLPAWFEPGARAPAAFLLVPLVARDEVEGLVLVGWPRPQRITLHAGHEALLQLLRTSAEPLLRERARALRGVRPSARASGT